MSALFLFVVALGHCFRTAAIVLLDLCRFVRLAAYSRSAVAAENLFLRKQLALFGRGRSNRIEPTTLPDG
jgi:putative transposase